MKKADGQLIELAGRNWLVSQLIQAGIEVARPERDRGIDLIAYIDPPRFVAVPIQMKAFSEASFSVYRKRYRGMLFVCVWHVKDSSQTVAFAMTWSEAQTIFRKMKWKADGVWRTKGSWFVRSVAPDGSLAKLLSNHRMTPGKWPAKIQQAANSK
jgi:hypothetical protein